MNGFISPLLGLAWSGDDWRVLATAVCCSVACGVIGVFLVLRRMSLLGDAISHAILPGLAVAFMLTGSREPLSMLAGALGAGVLTALLASLVSRWGRVSEDASLGVVFSSFFAIGVILMTWVARQVDLDANCVLYGQIELVALETRSIAGLQVPRALIWLSAVLVFNLAAIGIFYKELKIVCFDPALATAMGINAGIVHYGLMVMVAGTSVASFESVGSILVVAMLVAPGATASLLTQRLATMLVLAAGLAASAAGIGYLLAVVWNTSVAGMISTVSGVQFGIAVLASPRQGVVGRAIVRAELVLRIVKEDLLAGLYRRRESGDASVPASQFQSLAPHHPAWLVGVARRLLLRQGAIQVAGEGIGLSSSGVLEAITLVRSHRLWESYLSERLQFPSDHVHEPAERLEHFITPAMRQELERQAPSGADPHGKPIPVIED